VVGREAHEEARAKRERGVARDVQVRPIDMDTRLDLTVVEATRGGACDAAPAGRNHLVEHVADVEHLVRCERRVALVVQVDKELEGVRLLLDDKQLVALSEARHVGLVKLRHILKGDI
jgi:hypothetical protein